MELSLIHILIYNKPIEYAQLVLGGESDRYAEASADGLTQQLITNHPVSDTHLVQRKTPATFSPAPPVWHGNTPST